VEESTSPTNEPSQTSGSPPPHAGKSLSTTSKIIRVVLILILLGMIGAFVVERRAAADAQAAFGQVRQTVTDKKDAAAVQQVVGKAPELDVNHDSTREQAYVFRGAIRTYTVRVIYNRLDKGEIAEEAHLEVFNKLKGEQEQSETAAELPSI
jgi:hypothetical protein